jgi:hypothetical protein
MSNAFFWISLFILVIIPLLQLIEIKKASSFIVFKNPDRYFLRNYHAPPL